LPPSPFKLWQLTQPWERNTAWPRKASPNNSGSVAHTAKAATTKTPTTKSQPLTLAMLQENRRFSHRGRSANYIVSRRPVVNWWVRKPSNR